MDKEVLSSLDLLSAIRDHGAPERVIRIFRPAPTVAFSRLESRHPHFSEAERAARDLGFEPIIRPSGGRAVALDSDWIVLDVLTIERARLDNRDVFTEHGAAFVELLQEWGVDARFGPVPGEYCPGAYSVNARGRVKIVGTAQRVTRNVRLFSASLPVRVSSAVEEVLIHVNSILELDWDVATLGSLSDECPMTDIAIEHGLRDRFAGAEPVQRTLTEVLHGRGAESVTAGVNASR